MKQIAFLIGVAFCLPQAGSASLSCGSGTLASYIALGSAGCSIGADTFSSFHLLLSGITGATAISPASISISPSGSTTNPELTFVTNSTASSGQILEGLFSYSLTGASFTGDSVSSLNTSATANGVVTDIQNFCEAGMFNSSGVSGCTGTAGALVALGNDMEQATYARAAFLNVTDDITLDSGGTPGSASGGIFADSFTASNTAATPEPSLFFLLGLGLTAVGCCKYRPGKK